MRILICDDEKTYLNTLQIHVEEYMQSHHILYNMTTLLDATQLPEDEVFDLAFLDIQMPNVDGITLAKRLRQRNPKLALFFVTNYDEYQDDAMDLQAFRFFEKPFDVNRLYAGLDKAMEYIDGAYLSVRKRRSTKGDCRQHYLCDQRRKKSLHCNNSTGVLRCRKI